MKKWQTVSSTKILEHKRLTVYEDIIELPNGQKTDYVHFGKDVDSVCVVAVNDEGKVLLQKEYSYPPDEWLYQFPGGQLLINEQPEAGASRELAEEAGLGGGLTFLNRMLIDNRKRGDFLYVYLCDNLTIAQAVRDQEEEFIESWHSPKEIDQLIADGKILTATSLAAWTFYASHRTT